MERPTVIKKTGYAGKTAPHWNDYEGERPTLTITALTAEHVMYKLEGDRYVKPMTWELWKTKPDEMRLEK